MGEDVTIRLVFDGTAEVADGETLSLRAYARALASLLDAAQRVAGSILAQATDDPEYGSRGGRLPALAERLDLRLVEFRPGSTDLTVALRLDAGATPPGVLFETLPEQTALEMIGHIEREDSGRPSSAPIRRFLEALPAGIGSQRYVVSRGSLELRSITVGEPRAGTHAVRLPQIDVHEGRVTTLGFEPGATFLALRTHERTVRAPASMELVETADRLRGAVVSGTLVRTISSARWLRIGAAPFAPAPPGERLASILREDDGILRRLAQ